MAALVLLDSKRRAPKGSRLSRTRHDEPIRRLEPDAFLPGPDPDAPELLGGRGLRHPAALRHGDGGRHVSSRDDAAAAGAPARGGGLGAALAAAKGGALRRNPDPLPALFPVPGHPQAEPAEPAGALS